MAINNKKLQVTELDFDNIKANLNSSINNLDSAAAAFYKELSGANNFNNFITKLNTTITEIKTSIDTIVEAIAE